MKIVADTNIIVSGLLNPEGKPAQILNLILNQKIILGLLPFEWVEK
jgi:predicted nucleic acid-binding protein